MKNFEVKSIFSIALCLFIVYTFNSITDASTTAHFKIQRIVALCYAHADYDQWPLGEAPEPVYRVSIIDSVDDVYYDYCSYTTDLCGDWDFPDYTLVKDIPANSGASFCFSIYDYDFLEQMDAVGNHWMSRTNSMTSSAFVWNNNGAIGWFAPDCGGGTEGGGWANNYYLLHRIWFEDDTPPQMTADPLHTDDLITDTIYDNDTRLDFTWLPATDPDTGISGYLFSIYDVTDGFYIYDSEPVPAGENIALCPAECDAMMVPEHNHEYRFQVGAINGDLPGIVNPGTDWSENVHTIVDLVDPVTLISGPSQSSWQNANFSLDFSDSDDGVGLNPTECRWRVISDGGVTLDWTSRTCSGSDIVTVGPSGYADVQGLDTCMVYADSSDLARRSSIPAILSVSIDWSEDIVSNLQVFSEEGGSMIPEGTWQTDNDPWITWDTAGTISPIEGYSIRVDDQPPCQPDFSENSYAFPTDAISEGEHTIYVRAIDEAGNCGPVASFDIWYIVPTATPTSTPTPTNTPYPCIHHGDVNLNGSITASDSQMAFEVVLMIITVDPEQECAADCNNDLAITAGDAQAIFSVVMGTGLCADPLP